jgi:hypothetical protein
MPHPPCRRALGTAAAAPLLAALPALLLLGGAPAARAALPDEIQVYVDDLNEPGRFSLQEHVNTTPVGSEVAAEPGQTVAAHGLRLTSEFAYGVTPDLEAGLYLPVVLNSTADASLAGLKLRLKWVPLRPAPDAAGWFAGVNGELSQVAPRYDGSRRGFELRPILGWHDEQWLWAVNPVLDFALSRPDRSQPPEFQPAVKVARTVAPGLQAGIEYYTDLGPLGDVESWREQQHQLFLALDLDRKPWNVNFGIGYGLTAASDRWTVKMIIDVPLGW